MRVLAMIACLFISAGLCQADCVKNARGKTVCSDGQSAAAYNPNTGKGDTVNTAARMEQNSEPGRINISQTTYELVKDTFTCHYRGEIDAKNKGMLKMYYVDNG